MCGIAGIIHRGTKANIGSEMTAMLQSMKHRGPDSTGYSLYGTPGADEIIVRLKVAEQEDMDKGFEIHQKVKDRRAEDDRRIQSLVGLIVDAGEPTEYAYRYRINYKRDLRTFSDYI